MIHKKQWMLTHSTNLLESLASVTVICSIDREGTIASPFGSVEQLLFLGHDEPEPVSLEIVQDKASKFGSRFEEKSWGKYLPYEIS